MQSIKRRRWLRELGHLALAFSLTNAGRALADLTDELEAIEPRPSVTVKKAAAKTATSGASSELVGPQPAAPATAPATAVPTPAGKKAAVAVVSKPAEGKKGAPQEPASSLPVHFEGETLSGFRTDGTVQLHAQVKINQGDFAMEADHAQVSFQPQTDEVQKVIAKGRVKMRKIDPGTGEKILAESQIAEFDAVKQKVILSGKAQLTKGTDIIRGQVIHYDLKTGWLQANKVKGLVNPEATGPHREPSREEQAPAGELRDE